VISEMPETKENAMEEAEKQKRRQSADARHDVDLDIEGVKRQKMKAKSHQNTT
jgi:hypothetical protein